METLDLYNKLIEMGGFDRFTYGEPEVTVDGRSVRKVHYDSGDTVDSYGYRGQGQTSTKFIILSWDGRFFRKEGTVDSYGDGAWDGKFYEVKPEPVEVTDYVRV